MSLLNNFKLSGGPKNLESQLIRQNAYYFKNNQTIMSGRPKNLPTQAQAGETGKELGK